MVDCTRNKDQGHASDGHGNRKQNQDGPEIQIGILGVGTESCTQQSERFSTHGEVIDDGSDLARCIDQDLSIDQGLRSVSGSGVKVDSLPSCRKSIYVHLTGVEVEQVPNEPLEAVVSLQDFGEEVGSGNCTGFKVSPGENDTRFTASSQVSNDSIRSWSD